MTRKKGIREVTSRAYSLRGNQKTFSRAGYPVGSAITQIEILAFSQGQQQHFPKSEELLKNFWDFLMKPCNKIMTFPSIVNNTLAIKYPLSSCNIIKLKSPDK